MQHFIFSINATMPVFLVMVFGWVLMRLGLLNEAFTSMADRYVFRIALPCQLFLDIAQTDLRTDFDPRFVVFCFTTTFLMFSLFMSIPPKSVYYSLMEQSYPFS